MKNLIGIILVAVIGFGLYKQFLIKTLQTKSQMNYTRQCR